MNPKLESQMKKMINAYAWERHPRTTSQLKAGYGYAKCYDDCRAGFEACHDVMTKELESVKAERDEAAHDYIRASDNAEVTSTFNESLAYDLKQALQWAEKLAKALKEIEDPTISLGDFKDMAATEYDLLGRKEAIARKALIEFNQWKEEG